jgi:hypothetical protein
MTAVSSKNTLQCINYCSCRILRLLTALVTCNISLMALGLVQHSGGSDCRRQSFEFKDSVTEKLIPSCSVTSTGLVPSTEKAGHILSEVIIRVKSGQKNRKITKIFVLSTLLWKTVQFILLGTERLKYVTEVNLFLDRIRKYKWKGNIFYFYRPSQKENIRKN